MGRVLPLVGNCTVTHAFFPPSRTGKCCPFLSFFVSCLTRCLLSFFSVLLVLGSLFEKTFSGANFYFWESVLVVSFRVLFCLCFCFIIWFFVPENVLRKFSSGQVRCLQKFSGVNFCFMESVLVLCVLVLFYLCFCFITCFSAPETALKILLMSGLVFLEGVSSHRQLYCHTPAGSFSPFSKGEVLSVFLFLCFLCLAGCLCRCFTVLLFLGLLFKKIFGSKLLFCGVGVGLVCFGAVLPMFCLMNCFFPFPKLSRKNSLDVRSGVLGFFLSSLVFSPMSSSVLFFVFSRETAQVVTGHTPTRTLCSCSFFLSVSPPQPGLSPVLAVRPFLLAFCRGAILGPGRFLDSLGTSLRPFFCSDARRQGCFIASRACVVFPLFVLFCGFTPFLEA